MQNFAEDARRYRQQAEEARAQANRAQDGVAKRALYALAAAYDRMAERAEAASTAETN
jgi:hypothetical protein